MKHILSTIALATVLTGCALVPTSQINGTYAGKPFSVKLPKDAEWRGVELTVGTNGLAFKADSILAKNSPDAISATAAGRVLIIDASGKLVNQAVAAGVSAAAKSVVP